MSVPRKRFAVDPGRVSLGDWDPVKNRHIGEGDIAASYSGDRIGLGKPLRKPFAMNGSKWVCVSLCGRSQSLVARAYRVEHVTRYDGLPTDYRHKVKDAEAARNDPCGFYQGMSVEHAGEKYVLVGPPVELVAGEQDQLELFCQRSPSRSHER